VGGGARRVTHHGGRTSRAGERDLRLRPRRPGSACFETARCPEHGLREGNRPRAPAVRAGVLRNTGAERGPTKATLPARSRRAGRRVAQHQPRRARAHQGDPPARSHRAAGVLRNTGGRAGRPRRPRPRAPAVRAGVLRNTRPAERGPTRATRPRAPAVRAGVLRNTRPAERGPTRATRPPRAPAVRPACCATPGPPSAGSGPPRPRLRPAVLATPGAAARRADG
jgi:hypothetical protein